MSKAIKFTQPTFRQVELAKIRIAHYTPVTMYTRLRWLSQAFFLLVLIVVPTMNWLKLDFANNQFWFLGYEVTIRIALQMVVVFWLGIFFVNFLENYLIGRLLCGWVCPWGMFNRFGMIVNDRLRQHPQRAMFVVLLNAMIALAATIILLNFLIDLKVLYALDHPWFARGWLAFGVSTLIGFVVLQRLGFKFCETMCPFGMYLSVVRQSNSLRIAFDANRSCVECGLCTQVCPMDLSPRELEFKDPMNGGFGQCVLCGDCIDVCKVRMGQEGLPPPLRWNMDTDIIPLTPVSRKRNE